MIFSRHSSVTPWIAIFSIRMMVKVLLERLGVAGERLFCKSKDKIGLEILLNDTVPSGSLDVESCL